MVYMKDVVHCRLYAKLEMELLTWNFTQHLQVMDLDRPEKKMVLLAATHVQMDQAMAYVRF